MHKITTNKTETKNYKKVDVLKKKKTNKYLNIF